MTDHRPSKKITISLDERLTKSLEQIAEERELPVPKLCSELIEVALAFLKAPAWKIETRKVD